MDLPLNEYWAEEWLKCAEDKYYFFENYCYLQGDGGRTLFTPREYQRRVIDAVEDNRFVVAASGRQSGKCCLPETTVSCLIRINNTCYDVALPIGAIHDLSRTKSPEEAKYIINKEISNGTGLQNQSRESCRNSS